MHSEQQVQDFFQANSIVGALTPEQAAALLEGTPLLQGDTAAPPAEPSGGAPAPTAAPPAADPPPAPAAPPEPAATPAAAPAAAPPADPAQPVVLAKDGVHTIEYEKLVEARTEAQTAKQRADALQAQLDALKAQAPAAPAAAPAPPAPPPMDIDAKETEWLAAVSTGDDAKALALRKEINAELLRLATEQSTAQLTQRQQDQLYEQQVQAARAYGASAKTMYPQLDNTSPQANADAIDFVVSKRDKLIQAGQAPAAALQAAVEGAASLFGWKKSGAAPAPSPAADPKAAAAAAAAVIAKANEPAPTTLSDIPGARVDGRSPVEQLAAITNGADLAEAMANMSPERIDAFLNRI